MMSGQAWITRITLFLFVGSLGCRPTTPPPIPNADLPPVYPRSTITNPKVAEVASGFTKWIGEQLIETKPVFGRVEVLPPVPTLEPYGVGTYQKVPRLPVVLTTGPGWATLPADRREEVTATIFTTLSDRLAEARIEPPLRPTVTIQTPEGLELAWVNNLTPGRRLLHGDGE